MNIFEMMRLEPELEPLIPRIKAAIETAQAYMANQEVIGAVDVAQRLMKDPAVKDALAVAREVLDILQKSGIKS